MVRLRDSQIKQALQCTFGTFSFTYPAVIKTRTSPKIARIESITGFQSGMPAFVPVSKIVDNFNVTVAGTPLVAKGVTSFDPAAPGNQSFVLPLAYAGRTGVSDVATSDVKVTGATLVMTSGDTDNTVDCVTTGWPTVTTLAATSPVAAQVNLVASIDDVDAVGTVQFKKGAAVVATSPVVAGSATAELTDVSAGTYSYTAEFVPTDPAAYKTSTSTATSVTVAATQPCIDAQTALAAATAAVTNATKAASTATAAVKTATTKVTAATKASTKASKAATKASKAYTKASKAAKKAKSKSAKAKAKKALAKAKKANTKAKKAKSSASSKLKTAKSQLRHGQEQVGHRQRASWRRPRRRLLPHRTRSTRTADRLTQSVPRSSSEGRGTALSRHGGLSTSWDRLRLLSHLSRKSCRSTAHRMRMRGGPAGWRSEAVATQDVVLLGVARGHEPLGETPARQPGDLVAVLGAGEHPRGELGGDVIDVIGEDVQDPALALHALGIGKLPRATSLP
ncbi:Ig-like domain-containing protein [Aeromicrobium sp. UC242_57]|uniref:Ig-like domain-containing protein n=1 Tax=Aeromicrobium sp. UC242_57 TaxID=3374624 RepID=UPI003792304F